MKTLRTGDGKVLNLTPPSGFFKQNADLAQVNRTLLDRHGVQAVDILGSVGAGKTTLTSQLVAQLKGRGRRVAAIAGDLTTELDAERIRQHGAEVVQINTDRGCHLDAHMIQNALELVDLENLDVLLIENVGNLICPGGYPLGAQRRMVVVSVSEGPHQVVKHPYIFQDAAVVAVNKVDLAGPMEVDPEKIKADVLRVKPGIPVVLTNGRTGQGVAELAQALGLEG